MMRLRAVRRRGRERRRCLAALFVAACIAHAARAEPAAPEQAPAPLAVLLLPRALLPPAPAAPPAPVPLGGAFLRVPRVVSDECGAAVAAAERRYSLMPGLLAAIALTESGRRSENGRHPWPWTTNTDGQGHFFDSKEEAIAFVRQTLDAGRNSVDVGCMQVNLRYHPSAFSTLEDAFDPELNADYAARFLRNLQAQFSVAGDWLQAAGFYHSMTPERAEGYRVRVMAELGLLAAPVVQPPPAAATAPAGAAPTAVPAASPTPTSAPATAANLTITVRPPPAVAARTQVAAGDLRALARRERNPMSAFRAMAIASALEGFSRLEAARVSEISRRNHF